jgi:hypothetical protein
MTSTVLVLKELDQVLELPEVFNGRKVVAPLLEMKEGIEVLVIAVPFQNCHEIVSVKEYHGLMAKEHPLPISVPTLPATG